MLKNKDIESVIYRSGKNFRIHWILTSWCNYSCPYCIQGIEHSQWIPEEIKIKQAKNLNHIIKINNLKNIDLKLIGGEVTYYDLTKILDELSGIGSLSILTNFSRDLEYFKNLYSYCAARGIHIHMICSKHAENKLYNQKMIQFTTWCRQNGFRDPQVSVVINDSYEMYQLEELVSNGVTNISLKAERVASLETTSSQVSTITFNKIKDFYNRFPSTKNGGYSYEVVLKDGTSKFYRDNKALLNDIDEDGLIADGYFCDYREHLMKIGCTGKIYEANCEPAASGLKQELGDLNETQDLILPRGIIYCNANKNNHRVCVLCNKQSISRHKDIFKESE